MLFKCKFKFNYKQNKILKREKSFMKNYYFEFVKRGVFPLVERIENDHQKSSLCR